jgi:hypothetical protein
LAGVTKDDEILVCSGQRRLDNSDWNGTTIRGYDLSVKAGGSAFGEFTPMVLHCRPMVRRNQVVQALLLKAFWLKPRERPDGSAPIGDQPIGPKNEHKIGHGVKQSSETSDRRTYGRGVAGATADLTGLLRIRTWLFHY